MSNGRIPILRWTSETKSSGSTWSGSLPIAYLIAISHTDAAERYKFEPANERIRIARELSFGLSATLHNNPPVSIRNFMPSSRAASLCLQTRQESRRGGAHQSHPGR